MKLRRTDNIRRPIEPALFTNSAAFQWLLVAISMVLASVFTWLVSFIWR